ncbi:hypothetical protein A6A07_16070 [Streptomyces sp. CB03911]|nr:hypothetical protein A6A07_16070 [Streptomyces sp. CB03911]
MARIGAGRYRPQPRPIAADSPQVVAARTRRSVGSSSVVRTLTLTAGPERVDLDAEVDRPGTEKFLKAAFPLDAHINRYASETRFGHRLTTTGVRECELLDRPVEDSGALVRGSEGLRLRLRPAG